MEKNKIDEDKLFSGGRFLAANNPLFYVDTFVWTEGFYLKYNLYGEVEEVANKPIQERANIPFETVRPASDLEILALYLFIKREKK